MTTKAAAYWYRVAHLAEMAERRPVVYNPEGKPLEDLPVIYGFNNGGPEEWLSAVLVGEDGVFLGSHICSHEDYMPHDLGILEGCRPDRHETFREHYPDGYRMEFVRYADASGHEGLRAAFERRRKSE